MSKKSKRPNRKQLKEQQRVKKTRTEYSRILIDGGQAGRAQSKGQLCEY